jgi:hypothetical protein
MAAGHPHVILTFVIVATVKCHWMKVLRFLVIDNICFMYICCMQVQMSYEKSDACILKL